MPNFCLTIRNFYYSCWIGIMLLLIQRFSDIECLPCVQQWFASYESLWSQPCAACALHLDARMQPPVRRVVAATASTATMNAQHNTRALPTARASLASNSLSASHGNMLALHLHCAPAHVWLLLHSLCNRLMYSLLEMISRSLHPRWWDTVLSSSYFNLFSFRFQLNNRLI